MLYIILASTSWLVLLDLSLDKHHLPFSLSLSSSLYIFISYFMARPELQWISDLSTFWWFRRVVSLFFRLYLSFPFRRVDKYFASYCHVFYSMSICLLLLLYHAWPTLRGRWILSFCYVNSCHAITSDLSVACFYLTHVYHLATVLSPDYLTCYYLTRPSCYVMTYLDYYQSLTMTCLWPNINLLTCLVAC